MKFVAPVSRILLGLAFLVFSLNYFVPFLPPQPAPPPEAMGLFGGLVVSKILTMAKVLELAAAIALLTNRFVPLALAVLAPIIVGITVIHLVLVPAGLGLTIGLVVLELAVAWSYRSAFKPMLRFDAKPDPVAHAVRVPASVPA